MWLAVSHFKLYSVIDLVGFRRILKTSSKRKSYLVFFRTRELINIKISGHALFVS